VSTSLELFESKHSHVVIHNWVHKADLQPISTVSADQLAVDETMICPHGQKFWLYDAVNLYTNNIFHVSHYLTANKQTTRWFLSELHRERRTASFVNSFSNVTLATAQEWLEALAVYHNSRQT